MKRRGFASLFVLACAVGACAEILGIDDGTPRTYEDASTKDAAADITTLPEAGPSDAPADVPADVPPSPLPCAKFVCNAVNEACCRLGDPLDASAQTYLCIAASATCIGGVKVTCADNANCTAQGHPGEECCAVVPDGGSVATSTACTKKGACSGADMCQPGDDENCSPDASCQPSVQTILGFDLCK
jgi:hypothetical protein